jgi:hypothetical protein
MFVFVLIVLAVAVTRLAFVVRNDRSLTAPRSHTHELDQHSPRLHWVV